MNFVDLFSGCGGFSLGFKAAGFEHLWGLDNNPNAVEVYTSNIGKCILADIRGYSFKEWEGKIDVVIGSPPCQTFSCANTLSRDCDIKLTNEFFRAVSEIRPKFWVMENVPAVSDFVGAPFKEVFDMSVYGLLQRRRRLFCSNIKLSIPKTKNKYLTEEQEQKLREFRPEGIIRKYPTITCRYNSFGRICPHIQDGNRVRVLNHEEALSLQTFPFYFDLGKLGQRDIEILIGNAVPPAFAYKVAMFIKLCKYYGNLTSGVQRTFV
ncbi:hypothetical protein A2Z67_04700 [Candidatus Woesebacteria bacterium RBG_13_36_22]|uniref:DNA (cytosine-5-)-methyltransferase n=1 Tax=Candidatus Woesebacteria bacterium RBG_13_36_22 TaxID=1802478 RepID=A0A1F7X2L5_9BACT|nr:MAG: hypothetical protein A2Z67_04700 [Candidatus Woesebacteria bacterium RBG_13_36_22]